MRPGRLGFNIGIAVQGLAILLLTSVAFAGFDSHGWRFVRPISVPAQVPEGPVVVPLASNIIEKCRADLADVRVVNSEGRVVPLTVGGHQSPAEASPFPARIYRIAKRPGAWTEIWMDKSAKVLSRGILIQTGSKEFVRRVEVRGSDNGKDLYVVRMDGLVIHQGGPTGLCSLGIEHPLNNFQYIALRIHDDGQPPLRIDSVLCYPPLPEPGLSTSLSARIVENRSEASGNSTVIIADLRDTSLPVSRLAIGTGASDFVKNVRIHCGPTASGPWSKVFEGTFFRLTRGDATKEHLTAMFKPQPCRFLMVELSGSAGPPVPVEALEAASTIPFVAFDHSAREAYRLFYGNPSAEPLLPGMPPLTCNVQTLASASAAISLGEEERNVPPPREESRATPPANQPVHGLWVTAGAIVLLLALLILFGLMARSRWARKKRRRQGIRALDLG